MHTLNTHAQLTRTGKRMLTNDFASIVYRIKLLGFNAVRIPFTFAELNKDLPPPPPGKKTGAFEIEKTLECVTPTCQCHYGACQCCHTGSKPARTHTCDCMQSAEFFPCMREGDSAIAAKTLDPELLKLLAVKGGNFSAPAVSCSIHYCNECWGLWVEGRMRAWWKSGVLKLLAGGSCTSCDLPCWDCRRTQSQTLPRFPLLPFSIPARSTRRPRPATRHVTCPGMRPTRRLTGAARARCS